MTWQDQPLQLWNQLSVQKLTDIFTSTSPSIVSIKRDNGEIVAQALVTVFVTDFLKNFNVVRPMSVEQVVSCVKTIMDKYYYFKPEDFKYCFDNVLFGHYGQDGKVLDRIDTATILKWLTIHSNQRIEEAESFSEKNHEEIKSQKTLVVSEKILEVFKAAVPDVDKAIPIMRPMKPKRLMSPFELELVKHFDNFSELHKVAPVNQPGDIEPLIEYDGKKMNAPDYVRIMIGKTTGKTL
jgi:hypothetical protein